MCSPRKELGHRHMYVWHEVRKAWPLEQFPLYSLGNARGGGCPVGASGTGVRLVGRNFGEGGGILLVHTNSSNCLNLCKSSFICLCIFSCMARESA